MKNLITNQSKQGHPKWDVQCRIGSVSIAHPLLKFAAAVLLLFCFSVTDVFGTPTTATLTLSSSKKFGTTSGSTLTDDEGNTWTCSGSNIQNTYNSSYAGQQFGTNKEHNTYVFTCTITDATITSVKATMASGTSSGSYAIKVGGTTKYSCSACLGASDEYGGTFTGCTGEIRIELIQASSGSKCGTYLGQIEVVYTVATPSTYTLHFRERQLAYD